MTDYALGCWLIFASLVLLIGTGAIVGYGWAVIHEERRGGCRGVGCRWNRWLYGRGHVRGHEGVGLRVHTPKEEKR
jgi:hypothetical protein